MKYKRGIACATLLLCLTGCGQNETAPPQQQTPPPEQEMAQRQEEQRRQQEEQQQEAQKQQEEQQQLEAQRQQEEQQRQQEEQQRQEAQRQQEAQQKPKVTSRELSRYGSEMTNRNENRLKNIRLAIKKVNGTVIESGETISFNELVGPTTQENGFAKATVYIDGQETEDYGGGICQLSSTLYNAAMEAGLKIVERHPHQGGTVHYVPEGRDATVSYGGVDLKIKNNKPFPVKIYASMDKNGVYVALKSIEQNG